MIKNYLEYIKEMSYEDDAIKNILFPKKPPETKEEVDAICKKLGISNYTIGDDLRVSSEGNVSITEHKNMDKLPIKFYHVKGYFRCYRNNLLTLEGVPEIIDGDFNCCNNDLINLDYFPKKFNPNNSRVLVHMNKLESMEGLENITCHEFYFSENNLYTLDSIPECKLISGEKNPVWNIIELLANDRQQINLVCKSWKIHKPVYKQDGKWFLIKEKLEDLYSEVTYEDITFDEFNKGWSRDSFRKIIKNYTPV